MDWKVFATTFLTIFIAELGDKTQIAAFAMSSQTRSLYSVLLGTILALVIAGSIGVLAGSFLGSYIAPDKLRMASGGLFIIMGLLMLLNR